MEVVFFPIPVVYVHLSEMPAARHVVCPVPNARSDVECFALSPDEALHVHHDMLRNYVAVLVFRAPVKILTKVDDDTWMGLTHSSCLLLVGTLVAALVRAAEDMSSGYGAHWVWVHCARDTYRPGPKQLREGGHFVHLIPIRSTMVVQRRRFRWTIGTVSHANK